MWAKKRGFPKKKKKKVLYVDGFESNRPLMARGVVRSKYTIVLCKREINTKYTVGKIFQKE